MRTKNKILFLLDLDHTLIYGSYATTETAPLLFQHNSFLKVYERPLARELVEQCKQSGDIIVFTTALRNYAKTIGKELKIEPIVLLSRKNCKMVNGKHKKLIQQEWIINYNQIIIIDDSPNVWIDADSPKIKFLVPNEFRGDANDCGLVEIVEEIKTPF